MNTQDNLTLQNWITAAQTAADSLHVFSAWLRAWQCHPHTGQLSADLFDAVIADLHAAGLSGWADEEKLRALRTVVTGGEA